jgi:hypothetical protein
MQLRHPRRPQKLVARFREQPDFMGSFLAPNRKINHQVLSASRDFQRCLTSVSLALPASHRSFTKIQDGGVTRINGVSPSHPQPSPQREKQNRSSGQPSQHTSAPVADLKRAYRRNIAIVEQGKKEVRQGTRLFLDHCVTGARLPLGHLKALQALGIVPKNIGAKQIVRWDFVSPARDCRANEKARSDLSMSVMAMLQQLPIR